MPHHTITIEIDVEPGQRPLIQMQAPTLNGDDVIFHLTNLVQAMQIEVVTKMVLARLQPRNSEGGSPRIVIPDSGLPPGGLR